MSKAQVHPVYGLVSDCASPASRSDRSPCFADLHQFTTHALASCLRASWMEASVTKVAVLEVLGETPVSSEPGEGALDHPATRQDDEALDVVAPLDDRQAQPRHLCHRSINLPSVVVAAIGPDQFEPGEAPSYVVSCRAPTRPRRGPGSRQSGQPPASAGLRCRPGHRFCGLHLLADVVTHLVVFTAPFSPISPLAVEKRSRRAGLAAHPLAQGLCSSAQIASQTPSR